LQKTLQEKLAGEKLAEYKPCKKKLKNKPCKKDKEQRYELFKP